MLATAGPLMGPQVALVVPPPLPARSCCAALGGGIGMCSPAREFQPGPPPDSRAVRPLGSAAKEGGTVSESEAGSAAPKLQSSTSQQIR
jgi:hypothetical protein